MSNSLRFRLPPRTLPPNNAPLVSIFNSLRFRLLLMLATVVIVTVGIAALVGSWAITSQFESFVKEGGTMSVRCFDPVSYTHLRAHETVLDLVCRLLLDKKKCL